MVNQQRIFDEFCKEIIHEKNDTRNQRWKNIYFEVYNDVLNIKFKLLDPKYYISKVFDNGNCNVVQILDSLENAFYCLCGYALNICRYPYRAEYGLLKTYTGYFTANILSVMKGGEQHILQLMGYQVKPNCENADEYTIVHPIKQSEELAFELFLSQSYYRKIKVLCEDAINDKYDSDVVMSMMLEHDICDIISFGVRALCEKIKKEKTPARTHDEMKYTEPPEYQEYHSENKLVGNIDDLDDDDLYDAKEINHGGEHPPKQFENPSFNRYNLHGSYNAQKVITDDLFDKMRLSDPMPKTIGSIRDKTMKPPYPSEVERPSGTSTSGRQDIASRTRSKHQSNESNNLDMYESTQLESTNASTRPRNQNLYVEMPSRTNVKKDISQVEKIPINEGVERMTNQLSNEKLLDRRKVSEPRTGYSGHTPQVNEIGGSQRPQIKDIITSQLSPEHRQRLNSKPDERRNQINEFNDMVANGSMDTRKNETCGEHARYYDNPIFTEENRNNQNEMNTEVRETKHEPVSKDWKDFNVSSNTYNLDYIKGDNNKVTMSNQGSRIPNLDILKGSIDTQSNLTSNDHTKRMHDRLKHSGLSILQNKPEISIHKETFYTNENVESDYVEINPNHFALAESVTEFKEGPTNQQMSRGSSLKRTGNLSSGKNTPTDEAKIMLPPKYQSHQRVPSIYLDDDK